MQQRNLAVPTRHRSYTVKLWQGDYFVLRHLRLFLSASLAELVFSGARVADIGCGEQPFRALIESLGGNYVGFDLTQNSLKTVDLLASVTHMPGNEATFDVILCTEVLEHVSDTHLAFRELSRLLRPGGKIIITSPFAYPLHEEPYDFVRLTPYQLTRQAAHCDLRVEQMITAGNEVEVMATVWTNLWDRMGLHSRCPSKWHRPCGASLRLLANATAYVVSSLVGRFLPQKYYLSTLCILTKDGA